MIRQAEIGDLGAIMDIVHSAQHALGELGIDQWQDGYPSADIIVADIERGVGYIYCDDKDDVLGYAAIVLTGEEAYRQIAEDVWSTSEEYVVVHRLCVRGDVRRRGIAVELMRQAAEHARSVDYMGFRIDTHKGNIRMLRMLDRLGFVPTGIIHYSSGERIAYELNLGMSKIL